MTKQKTEASPDNQFDNPELRFLGSVLEKEDMQVINAFMAKAGVVSDDEFFGSM